MELKMVGGLIIAAVAIIIGLAFLTGSIAGTVNSMTEKVSVPITTKVTFPTNTTALTLNGQAVESVVVINGTTTVAAGNYTVSNRVVSNGQLIATIIGVGANPYSGNSVNISYTYEPFGYATDGGTRSILSLVLIFVGLAIAIIALVPALRSGVVDFIGG